MTPKQLLACIGLISMTPFTWAAEKATAFHWPQHYKAAVSLSYDDALDSQLDNAIPALNKYNLKGTFYLILSSPAVASRLPEWRAAAEKGHELANHTLFHQCSHTGPGREWVKPESDLDKLTVAQMRAQILLANTFLYAIDGKTGPRTLTSPCLDTKASDGNYVEAVKNDFVAIENGANSGVIPDMKAIDPAYIPVILPSNITGEQLIAIVKEAAKQGTMANIKFHGVGGDYITTSKEAHEELLKYLADNRDTYWTDTMLNIMQYVNAQNKK